MNKVFIATSLDGFIADKNGDIDWLEMNPDLNNIDTGYVRFTSGIDALVMGRGTFEKVCSFDIPWPYKKPVFVVSSSLSEIPKEYSDHAHVINGNSINDIISKIHKLGYNQLYIDGGKLIQSFLREDLIDEMIITIIPLLLGEGIPLFSEGLKRLEFECKSTKLFLESIVQNHFVRKRDA